MLKKKRIIELKQSIYCVKTERSIDPVQEKSAIGNQAANIEQRDRYIYMFENTHTHIHKILKQYRISIKISLFARLTKRVRLGFLLVSFLSIFLIDCVVFCG